MSGISEKQMAIATRLSRRMKEVGIGQKELADLIDTSKQQIWKLENGKISLQAKWAEKIAPHLQVSPSWLLMITPNDAQATAPAPSVQLTEDALHAKQEAVLLGIWRRLSFDQRDNFIRFLDSIVGNDADAA